jgi:hypothetical protein
MSRRRAIAIGGCAALAPIAGCSTVLDAFGGQILSEVNILNQLERGISGSIEITDPEPQAVLDASFAVPSVASTGESNVVAYGDVWTTTGEYLVELELADTAVGGVSRISRQVSIGDPDADMVAISVGSGSETEPIAVRVGESFSEFARTGEERTRM